MYYICRLKSDTLNMVLCFFSSEKCFLHAAGTYSAFRTDAIYRVSMAHTATPRTDTEKIVNCQLKKRQIVIKK